MDPADPNLPVWKIDISVRSERQVVLGDLEPLGQIGVEVILPMKNNLRLNPTVKRQGHPEAVQENLVIQNRQNTGKT